MEFSPDSVLIATGDRNGAVHIWETQSGQEFHKLNGHKGRITDISWRMDSNVVATASEDGTIKTWNLHNGQQIKSWNAHGSGVLSVEFAHDGRIVSCGRDNQTMIWDGNGGKKKTFPKTTDMAIATVFSHDGKRVITGDWTGRIQVWDGNEAKHLGDLQANPPMLVDRVATVEKRIRELNAPYEQAVAKAKVAADSQNKIKSELDGMLPKKMRPKNISSSWK